MAKPLFEGSEWSFAKIDRVYDAIATIAVEDLKLDTYPNQIEIISSDQMLDCYASIGLPVMYNHWSFGKRFLQDEYAYRKGMQGLAYEIVINSSPCISYLMEENSMTMQTLVVAHAAFGHNHFFKNNYLFRQWTDAEGILDYLVFAKKYIAKCEEKHGHAAVERTLDACHALMNHGVDRYRRPSPLSKEIAENRQREREEYVQRQANDLWRTLPNRASDDKAEKPESFPKDPEENLLYFLEKHSPILEGWQREVVRIVRKIAQYFYPQKQTQVGNEGWASFVHYYIMNRLRDKGLITDGSMLEFLHSHSGVVFQPDYNDKRYSGINPYHLGFSMFMDIKRVCEAPTSEDREWFPELAGTEWLPACHDAVANYRDESFIQQFLSPTVMRKNKMFLVENRSSEEHMTINNIHNERGFRAVRNALSRQYSLAKREPDIQVVDANLLGDRTLRLRHVMYDGVRLNKNTHDVLLHLQHLWGYKVEIETVDHSTGESAESVVIGNG